MKRSRSMFSLVSELMAIILIFAVTLTAAGSSKISDFFSELEYPRFYNDYVEKYAFMYGVDENLIYAVIKAESGFDASAVSKAGAVGLMQIMPSTYTDELKKELSLDNDVSELSYPDLNIKCGTYYLAKLLKTYSSSVVNTSCAYNAGQGNVNSWLTGGLRDENGELIISRIPFSETRRYSAKVSFYYREYQRCYGVSERESSYTEADTALSYAKKYGALNGVDYNLIMAVIMTESSFNQNALSKSFAMGLMQIKESTYNIDIKPNLSLTDGAERLFEVEYNIMCGAYYLRWLDWYLNGKEQIAAAYHGGINSVRLWLSDKEYSNDGETLIISKIPSETTSRYVEKLMRNYGVCVELYSADPINR